MNDLIRRDDAIKEIKKYAEIYANRQATDSSQYYVGKEDGCYSAIYVLEIMKPAEPKDTQGHSMKKDMEALIGDINPKEIASHIETDTLGDWCKILRNEMLCTLDKMEMIVEPKVGHWILHIDDLFPADSTQECSICHEEQNTYIDDNYCPNCGAKMEGETYG